jgi:hypothetical protein
VCSSRSPLALRSITNPGEDAHAAPRAEVGWPALFFSLPRQGDPATLDDVILVHELPITLRDKDTLTVVAAGVGMDHLHRPPAVYHQRDEIEKHGENYEPEDNQWSSPTGCHWSLPRIKLRPSSGPKIAWLLPEEARLYWGKICVKLL